MPKRVIVADSPPPAKAVAATRHRAPHPLVGAEFVAGAAAPAQLPPPSVPEIAFAGRSNAGKSSAINALAGRTRLAFASRTPGRTQMINLFRLRSGAIVADLPGYGYAAVGKKLKESWQEFLWHYVTTRATLAALILVVDARHGLKAQDIDVLSAFVPSGRPVLVLATKADKLSTTQKRQALAGLRDQLGTLFAGAAPNLTVLLFSATTFLGVEDAEAIIDTWMPVAAV
jgi:GTP-binding protein